MPAKVRLWNYGEGTAGAVPESRMEETVTLRVERPKPIVAEAGKGKMKANAKPASGNHRIPKAPTGIGPAGGE